MITYEQVQLAMTNPPTKELIDIFNDLSNQISDHPDCVNDDHPFDKLYEQGRFCLSATSIQPEYIAFVLGKHVENTFPENVIANFFNIDSVYKLQFGKIKGKEIDGCICVIHSTEKVYDLKEVYENIYS